MVRACFKMVEGLWSRRRHVEREVQMSKYVLYVTIRTGMYLHTYIQVFTNHTLSACIRMY